MKKEEEEEERRKKKKEEERHRVRAAKHRVSGIPPISFDKSGLQRGKEGDASFKTSCVSIVQVGFELRRYKSYLIPGETLIPGGRGNGKGGKL